MPRPKWTPEQARAYGRKGGLQRKGKALRSPEYKAGFQAGWIAGKRAQQDVPVVILPLATWEQLVADVPALQTMQFEVGTIE